MFVAGQGGWIFGRVVNRAVQQSLVSCLWDALTNVFCARWARRAAPSGGLEAEQLARQDRCGRKQGVRVRGFSDLHQSGND